MTEGAHPDRLHFGAAWYPEHWPAARWPEDVRLMREAGFTVARMAEFAWSTMEPEPGRFELDWLEAAVALLAEQGIVSVLGTPTAAPPAWLVQQHPDLMAVGEDGRRVQFGTRCHACVSSPELLAAGRRVAGAMAERFGRDPHVIGWQLDNEYNRVCHCERCQERFRGFLAERYGSLAALNDAWATRYWSQTYSAWDQIPIPRDARQAGMFEPHHPALRLEFRRFVSESYRRFQRVVIDELRRHVPPEVWVTHNFMGWFEGIDGYAVSADLDLASWDCYVGSGHFDPLTTGAAHDLTRGFKRRPFWVMETQVGHTNHTPLNNVLDRGEMRTMAWHAVAHGADGLLYWQWRAAPNGQEQHWGTVVDQAGRPRPVYEEVREIGRAFAAASSVLAGTVPAAETAVINSYDARWALHQRRQRLHEGFDYVAHLRHYHRALAGRNIAVDVVSADAPLDGYKLVVAPALHLLSEARAARLRAFAERGGHLVLGVRSGVKDDRNAFLPLRPPGALAEAAGAEVEESYALADPVPVSGSWFSGTSRIWAERLAVLDEERTEVLARFGPSNGWLDGRPAVVRHPCGAGRVYLVGVYLDDDSQQTLLDRIAAAAGVAPALATPAGVEVRERVGPDGAAFVLINHRRSPERVAIPWPAREHLGDRVVEGDLELAPLSAAVLTRTDGSGAADP